MGGSTVGVHIGGIEGLPSGVMTAIENLENAHNAQATAGASTATFGGTGNVNVQVTSTGVQPGATGADNILAIYSLPAKAFNAAGQSLQVVASGSFGATVNNKRVKIIIGATAPVVGQTVSGGTAIADTGTVTTNGGGWQIGATVVKTGAAGSNTQVAIHNQAQVGAAVSALVAPQALALTESGTINVVVTGNATTAATDIVFNYLENTWQN